MEQVTSQDGTVIGFWRSGSGPPLVLVHGTMADHRRWDALLPELEQRFTVYAVDRRGRGGSGDAVNYAVLREAEDVAAVVEAAGAASGRPVLLLGHSYGGICCLEASLLTGRIDRMVLYEPPIPNENSLYPPGTPERIQALVDSGDNEAALEVFVREALRMPEQEFQVYRSRPMWPVRVQLAPTIPRELVIDQTYHFEPSKFANHRVPTLLLLGGDSPAPFRRAVELVDAALPNSRVTVLPGQRHVAMDTHPKMFLHEVGQFFLE